MLGALLVSMLTLAASAGAYTAPAPVTTPPPVPPCRTAHVFVAAPLDSGSAKPGQVFKFTVADADAATPASPAAIVGAQGYGIVSVVRHARGGGVSGALVLESRFVVAADGSHVPASFVHTDSGFVEGKSNDAPGALNWIPYVSLFSHGYNALHKGSDVTIAPSDRLRIVVGDDSIMGGCQVKEEEQVQASR